MTRAEVLNQLRGYLSDDYRVGWEYDNELVSYMDRACSFISNLLIGMRHNVMIKRLNINGPTQLPSDFTSFVGKIPAQVIEGQVIPYGYLDEEPEDPADRWDDPNMPRERQAPAWRTPDDTSAFPSWASVTKNQAFKVLYWSRLPYFSSIGSDAQLPYQPEILEQVIDVARMLALNKNEYDLAQDISIFQQVQTALQAVVARDEQ